MCFYSVLRGNDQIKVPLDYFVGGWDEKDHIIAIDKHWILNLKFKMNKNDKSVYMWASF